MVLIPEVRENTSKPYFATNSNKCTKFGLTPWQYIYLLPQMQSLELHQLFLVLSTAWRLSCWLFLHFFNSINREAGVVSRIQATHLGILQLFSLWLRILWSCPNKQKSVNNSYAALCSHKKEQHQMMSISWNCSLANELMNRKKNSETNQLFAVNNTPSFVWT